MFIIYSFFISTFFVSSFVLYNLHLFVLLQRMVVKYFIEFINFSLLKYTVLFFFEIMYLKPKVWFCLLQLVYNRLKFLFEFIFQKL